MIEVKTGTERRDGACSACTSRNQSVLNIGLWPTYQGITFRLCEKCRKELVGKLQKAAQIDGIPLCKLSQAQQKLLKALSFKKWMKAPLLTKAATILSLEERGLIKMQVHHSFIPPARYADYELLKIKQEKSK